MRSAVNEIKKKKKTGSRVDVIGKTFWTGIKCQMAPKSWKKKSTKLNNYVRHQTIQTFSQNTVITSIHDS